MAIDIILGIIVLVSMIIGFKKGLAVTLTHTLGWVVAIICGVCLGKPVQGILKEKTGIYDSINDTLIEKANEAANDPVVNGDAVPEAFVAIRKNLLGTVVDSAGTAVVDIAYTVICFLLIVLAARLVTFVFCFLFSKKHNDGAAGFFDGVLGLLMGAARGVLLALLFLGLVFPFLAITSPELARTITDSLDSSYVAGYLYDNNILMDLLTLFKKA